MIVASLPFYRRGNIMPYSSIIHTPLGYMRAVATNLGLARLDWQQMPFTLYPVTKSDDQIDNLQNDVSRETIHQLDAYLAGKLSEFTLPLDLSEISTPLQTWLEILGSLSYGTTISYADYAEKWGNRGAARAAGGACQRNPIPIIIPCHRVLKADGSYDNYSGGDNKNPRHPNNIYRKQWLIEMERKSASLHR